ncbi:LutC/YkgG family protein [Pseudonocardia endophytica]|uniref:L-lactate dehydrogenase complex protein LldG n=1 Tax=Pseudonocardia endophytica TaxID=401976 RepID=A0A4R1HY59_PSEEN|nr:LUD domain-containing protein [Pseudonocardia endophytica]TCK22502.1 L-lactate dehydrogenase complex protein LldG [Pseudonocardia endophytica]
MTAREEILAKARRALVDVPDSAPEADVPYVRPQPSTAPATPEQVEQFAERVADYRAVVERVAPDAVADRLRAAVEGARRIVVPPGFPAYLVPDGVETVHDGPDVDVAELDRCDGVVSTAALGIATTGTIVLDHGAGQGRRAATLVPDLHVCVVRADQVVAGVPEAVSTLDASRPQTWISGPSATSDIELDRVEGVHGPRTLHVLLVG